MKTAEEAAKEYADKKYPKIGLNEDWKDDGFDEGYDAAMHNKSIDEFKAGVEFAQRWFDVSENRPPYYKSILIKCPEGLEHDNPYDYTSVWLAVNDNGDDIYTVCGTNIILQHNTEEWRPVNYE